MPTVSITAQTSAAPDQVWQFIEDMGNWAPFLTGYQSHRQIDDRHSTWTVKGELAGLSRVADIDVTITAWEEPRRVAFELQGVDEPFSGFGEFRIVTAEGTATPPKPFGLLDRIRGWFARQILSVLFGRQRRRDPIASDGAKSNLECSLTIEAGGGSGPIMNLLLAPMLPTIAQDMSREIVNALEQATADGPTRPSMAGQGRLANDR